jgi:hypothetical protein
MAEYDRKANQNWTISKGSNGTYSHEAAQLAVLQDVRDELQKLNSLLACPNFIGIPKTLREIKRATNRIPTIARPRKPKVKK